MENWSLMCGICWVASAYCVGTKEYVTLKVAEDIRCLEHKTIMYSTSHPLIQTSEPDTAT